MSQRFNPYFQFYPADFMTGVRGMTPQEVGVYTMLLCRIYEEDGPVEYHLVRLATYCGMRIPAFTKTIEKLIELGKFTVVDGCLSNHRAEVEIAKRAHGLNVAKKAGAASAKKRQQKQDADTTDVQQPFNQAEADTDTDTEEGGGGSASVRDDSGAKTTSDQSTFREQILTAIGVDPTSGLTGPHGRMIGTQADMFEASRWINLGLTEAEVVAEITTIAAAKPGGPPSSFLYFSAAMARLAEAKTSPTPEIQPSTKPTGGRRNERQAFDRAINAVADGLSAGTIQLDDHKRDPLAIGRR